MVFPGDVNPKSCKKIEYLKLNFKADSWCFGYGMVVVKGGRRNEKPLRKLCKEVEVVGK